MNKKQKLAEGALFTNALIWGGTFVIIKSALDDISSMVFVTVRFGLASILFLPFAYNSLKILNSQRIKEGIILGILLYVGFATQTFGLQYTTATKSAFITGTFVIFTPIFQTLLEKRIPAIQNIVGIVFVISGIIFLTSKSDSVFSTLKEISESFNIGDFLTLICAVFYALYIVYLDMITEKHDAKSLTFMQLLTTGILSFFTIYLFSFSGIENIKFIFNENVITAILYTTIFATILTTLLQTKYQSFVTPTKASIIFSMEPIFAAVFAFIILHEKLSLFGFLGCVLIFCGILISELWKSKSKNYE